MKRWGLGLMAMGALSFLLPAVGMQFQIFALFGEAEDTVALLAGGLGFVVFLLGFLKGDTGADGNAAEGGPEGEDAGAEWDAAEPKPFAAGEDGVCPDCGAVVEWGDRFCGDCGAAAEQPARSSQEPAAEPVPSGPPTRGGFGGKLVFGLIGVGVLYGAYQLFRPVDSPPPEVVQTEYVLPTDEELAVLSELLDQAKAEENAATLAGDRELQQRKAQEHQHCKTALSHAMDMRVAITQLREAEAKGDFATVASFEHIHRHYMGQLYLMLPYVHEPLAVLVRRWAEG